MIDEKENKNEELEVNLEEVETEKEVNVPLNPLEKLQQMQEEPSKDEDKHLEFWKYISRIRYTKVDTADESVSFGKPDNKMPIEKYFALHVNIKNIRVKRQAAYIIR